jgi:hypothetical protein
VLTGWGIRQQSAEFFHAQKPFTRFLADFGHHEFSGRALEGATRTRADFK